ncbi:MAG TPA: hypothetical protein VGH04_05260 [Gemmatimonadaceae bacterium]|jgi:hypothetical protein
MLVLFGGGDGGGFWVGADGKLHPIPPYGPDILRQLRAVSALVAVATHDEGTFTKEAESLAERLSTTVIPEVTKFAGATQLGDSSIAFVDGDDGFVCGSTGKLPIPIPHHVFGNIFSPVRAQPAQV